MATGERALIVGAGADLSASLARSAPATVCRLLLAARDTEKLAPLCAETGARAFACDATDADKVAPLFAALEAESGPPDVVVYNASGGPGGRRRARSRRRSSGRRGHAPWRFSGGAQAARRDAAAGHGTILFTGASASVKGYARSSPVAMGKFALRGLAQSMARELRRKAFMSPISSSMARSAGAGEPARTSPTRCSIPTRSPQPICSLSPAAQRLGLGGRVAALGREFLSPSGDAARHIGSADKAALGVQTTAASTDTASGEARTYRKAV